METESWDDLFMGAFGEKLRRERERRGVTVHDIAESTKISSRFLRALEAEDYENLPGGIFNRGFVRAYCKYLGMDEEEMVAEFDAALQAHEAEQLKLLPVEPVPDKKPTQFKLPPKEYVAGAIVAAILVMGAATWWLSSSSRRPSSDASAPAASSAPLSGQSNPANLQPTPAKEMLAKAEGPDSRQKADASPGPNESPKVKAEKKAPTKAAISLEVRTHEDSWVSIMADGKMLMEGIMPAESSKHFRAQKNMVLKTGNAGGVEISYNGKPLPPLGTLTFTPQGLLQ